MVESTVNWLSVDEGTDQCWGLYRTQWPGDESGEYPSFVSGSYLYWPSQTKCLLVVKWSRFLLKNLVNEFLLVCGSRRCIAPTQIWLELGPNRSQKNTFNNLSTLRSEGPLLHEFIHAYISKRLLPSGFPIRNVTSTGLLHARYIPRPYISHRFNHLRHIRWKYKSWSSSLQVPSSPACHIFPLGSKHFRQHPVFEHPYYQTHFNMQIQVGHPLGSHT